VDFEELSQTVPKFGKAHEERFRRGPLAELFLHHELGVDQFEYGIRVAGD
jgi:hypothetical protein